MVVSRWDFAAVALVLVLTPLVLVQPAVLAVAALPLAVAWVAAYPTAALCVAVPVAMFPGEHRVGSVPLYVPVLAVLEAGLLARAVRDKTLAEHRRLLWVAAGLAVWLSASYVLAPRSATGLPGSGRNHLLTVLLAVGLVVTVALVRPRARTVLVMLAVVGTGLCGWALASGTTSYGTRLETADLANPNSVGYVGAVTVLVLLALGRRWLVLIPVAALVVVQAQSRGADVAVAVGVVVLLVSGRRYRVPIAVGVVVGGVLFWPHAVELSTAGRSAVVAQESTQTRTQLAHLGVSLAAHHPLLGVGYRRFPDYSMQTEGAPLNAHDEYLRTAAESGIPAFLLLLGLFAVAFRIPGRAKAPLIGGLAGFAFANTFSLLTVSLPVFLLLGLAWAHAGRSLEEESGLLR